VGRPQLFDTAAVVRAARDVFWDKGFDGASLGDLERATGLARSSLYHAFGSKDGLFRAAAEDYLETVVRPRLRPLTGDAVGPDALPDYLTGLAAALRGRPADAPRGCLLLHAALGRPGDDAVLRRVVADYRAELTAAFARGLAARYPGGVPDADDGARALTSLVASALLAARLDTGDAVAVLDAARERIRGWDAAAG